MLWKLLADCDRLFVLRSKLGEKSEIEKMGHMGVVVTK